MQQFKPAIAVMAVLVVVIVGWTLWRLCPGSFIINTPGAPGVAANPGQGQTMAMGIVPAAAKTPMGPPIDANAKMLHAYWGNCNKCHVTTGGGKPVSKVMAGAPVAIAQTMTHKYWGNCVLCHQVVDGFQANGAWVDKAPVPGAGPGAGQGQAQAVALNWLTAKSIGLNVTPVTQAMMQRFNLNEDNALLVLDVTPGSVADKAEIRPGDEIVRVDRFSVKTIADMESALNSVGPDSNIKIGIIRNKTSRNMMLTMSKDVWSMLGLAAATAPVVPVQVAVPAQSAVPVAPAQVAVPMQGVAPAVGPIGAPRPATALVAVAAAGPGLTAPVAGQFESAPYFVLIDPAKRAFKVEANPNAGLAGYGIQTAQLMANLGVGSVIAGGFSQEAMSTLGSNRIMGYPGLAGSVQDALAAYQAGGLNPAQGGTAQALSSVRPGVAPSPTGVAALPQTLY